MPLAPPDRDALGASIFYYDPHLATWNVLGLAVTRADDLDSAVAEADLVILVQNHRVHDTDGLALRAQQSSTPAE